MVENSVIIKYVLFLILIKTCFTYYCIATKEFIEINRFVPEKFYVDKENEFCLKYKLNSQKNIIGISFMKANLYTVEVIIYNSTQKITKVDGEYINESEKYLIGENKFKEINIDNIEDYMYIIIRERKEYHYNDYIKIYDASKPIILEENTPMTITYFLSNKKYSFEFSSQSFLNLTYSSKIKRNNIITITRNGNTETYYDDFMRFFYESDITQTFLINITQNTNEEDESKNQEFSIIYYENLDTFKTIETNEIKTINYLSINYEQQFFYFYIDASTTKTYNTINFQINYKEKNNKYLFITTNEYNSENLPVVNDYEFTNDKLLSSYDHESDEFLRYYFEQNNKIKYILIKVEIKNLEKYIKPEFFNIAYGEDVTSVQISQTIPLTINSLSYIPFYQKFNFENSDNYLFKAPYDDYCLLINGNLLEDNQINTLYINEKTDLHESSNIKSFTARIFSYKRTTEFIFEKYNKEDVTIINLATRIKEAMKFEQKDCNKEMHIILRYDINSFSYGENKFANYWTSDDDMEIYYKDNSDFIDGSFFPSIDGKNKLEKETVYNSSSHLDIFTTKCQNPGYFYIRPYKKEFKGSIIHDTTEDYLKEYEIFLGTEIVQIESRIKNAPPHIYFAILNLGDNEINISPDTPGLFKETKIDKNNRVFKLEIDTKKYKMDQMAINLTSDSNNLIEVLEATDCESCLYQNIANDKNQTDLVINNNNFVIILNDDIISVSIKFKNLNDKEAYYGIVDLPVDDYHYIPSPYHFKSVEKQDIKPISINMTEKEKDNDNKRPYKAFIFSRNKTENVNYKIDIEIKTSKKSNVKLFEIILVISMSVSAMLSIVFVVVILLNKRSKKTIIDEIDENVDPLMPQH